MTDADDPIPTAPDEILGGMLALRGSWELLEKRREVLISRRRKLLVAGRACHPPLTHQAMADALGVSKVFVTKMLAKEEEHAAIAAATR